MAVFSLATIYLKGAFISDNSASLFLCIKASKFKKIIINMYLTRTTSHKKFKYFTIREYNLNMLYLWAYFHISQKDFKLLCNVLIFISVLKVLKVAHIKRFV